MPGKETCPMDQRVAFIADWLREEWTMTDLAVRYGISRKTAYKWGARYEAAPATAVGEPLAGAAPARARDGTRVRRTSWRGGSGRPIWGPRNCALRCSARSDMTCPRRARWAISCGGTGSRRRSSALR